MNSTQEAKALQQMFMSMGRELEGRLLPFGVVYPSLAKASTGNRDDLPPAMKARLWNAAVELLLANATFTDKSVAKPLREARDEDAA